MISPQDLLRQFQDVTGGLIKHNEDTGAVRILRATVKTLETVTKKIDAFLKSKNVDVGERLAQLSGKTASLKDRAKSLMSGSMSDIKSLGLRGFLKTKTDDVKSSLHEQFTSDTEGANAPPSNSPPSFLSKLNSSVQKLTDSVTAFTTKVPTNFGSGNTDSGVSIDSSTSSGKEEYQDSLNAAKARADKRAAEVEAEKQAVKDKQGKPQKKKTNWLSSILGGITKLGGTLIGGFGKIALRMIPGIGKMTGSALRLVLGSFVPTLAGSVAKATASAVGGAAKLAGKGAWSLARMTVPALWAGAKMVGGAVVGAVGATGLAIAGGVGLAGLLIYGGYKLYKYLNRNEVKGDIFGKLTRLRLLMYGLNDSNKEHYYRVLELEMMMKDYVQFKDGKVVFSKLDKDIKEKVMKLFEVKYEEKEKYAILNKWFSKRFLVGLKTFLDALMPTTPNIYLDTIDKLNPDQVFGMVGRLIVPTELFDTDQIPAFENPKSPVSKQEVDNMMIAIRTLAKEKSKSLDGEDPTKLAQSTAKKAGTNAVLDKARANQITEKSRSLLQQSQDKLAQGPASAVTANSPATSAPSGASQKEPEAPNQEGETKAPESTANAANGPAQPTTNPNGKLNIAPGKLQTGDTSLQGIKIGTNGDRDKLMQLDPTVFKLFTGMAKEFNTLTGKQITVNESFRTYQDQMALRKKYPNKAAKPGNSIHEFGMAVDINSPEADALDKSGLMRKYGFTRPVGGETWHLEPAGVAVNPNAAKTDKQARQQALMSSPGRGGGGYGATKSTPLGKRNTELQKKLFNEGNATEVDVLASLSPGEEAIVNKGPVLSSSDKPPTSGVSSNSQMTSSAAPSGTGKSSNLASAQPPSVNSTVTNASIAQTAPSAVKTTGLDPAPKPANANLDLGAVTDPNITPEQAVRKASGVVGMNPDTMVNFAKVESSLNPKAGANSSSAKGLFQIVKGTWNGLLAQEGPKYNVPKDADIYDPYYNSLMGISYAKSNTNILPLGKEAGLSDEVSLYLAHHFGPGGARRIIKAYMKDPNSSTQQAVSSNTYAANQAALAGKTVGQYFETLKTKMATAANTPASAYGGANKTANSSSKTIPSTPSTLPPTPDSQVASSPTPAFSASSAKSSTSASTAFDTAGYGGPVAVSSPIRTPSLPKTELPPQSSPTHNLDKNQEILSEQLTTLQEIRDILKGGSSKVNPSSQQRGNDSPASSYPVMTQPQTAPLTAANTKAVSPPPATPTVVGSPMRVPSSTSVSMSRRPIA